LYSLQQTVDGGYILGGTSSSNISFNKTENSRGLEDYWIVKTTRRGRVQWDKTIGGSNYEFFAKILEIKRNIYALGGSSASGISADKTGDNRGQEGKTLDYWIVKLRYVKPASTVITGVQNTSKLQIATNITGDTFIASPNPAKHKINIQSTGKAIYTLTNGAGKTIITQTINGNGVINVANVPAGIYYLKNTTTGIAKKIVIVK